MRIIIQESFWIKKEKKLIPCFLYRGPPADLGRKLTETTS